MTRWAGRLPAHIAEMVNGCSYLTGEKTERPGRSALSNLLLSSPALLRTVPVPGPRRRGNGPSTPCSLGSVVLGPAPL